MKRRRRGKRGRDFWRAWREHRHRWEEEGHTGWHPGMPPPPEMAHAWRSFFHEETGRWPEDHWVFGGRRFKPWRQGIDSFNPFVASLLSKGGGLLPLLALSLLSDQPRYGNEIMDAIGDQTRGQWVANPGAIYPLMATLEDQGLVRGEWEDPDKRTIRVYSLTDEGQRELARLKSIVRPKLEEAIEALQRLVEALNGDSGPTGDPPGYI